MKTASRTKIDESITENTLKLGPPPPRKRKNVNTPQKTNTKQLPLKKKENLRCSGMVSSFSFVN